MFQFFIKRYGTTGDGLVGVGAKPFELVLRVVGVSEASPKNVWLKDYDTLSNAKIGAAALFATGTVTPWVDSVDSLQSLSAIFTPTF